MNKTKFLTTALVVLVLLNLGTLTFILFGQPPHPPKQDPRSVIIERLHLDQKQIEQYQLLIEQHQRQTNRIAKQIADDKNELFRLLETDDTLMRHSLLDHLGHLHRQMDVVNVDHFLEIKKMCTPDQLLLFNDLTKELASLFERAPRKQNVRPRD